MQNALSAATLIALALVAWHLLLWPRLVSRAAPRAADPPEGRPVLRPVTLIMPAHNEAAFIEAKIANLAALSYPRALLRIVIACDGCTDATVPLARAALARFGLEAVVLDHPSNRGKLAVLQEAIAASRTEWVALTDVSAMLPADALLRAARWFADPATGAVGGTYALERPGSEGERAYWAMQIAVKRGEAALGAPLGMHGAFWAFRRAAWAPVEADIINDDFVMPMRMFLRGWRLGYDPSIVVREAERSDPAIEARRRRRIAAGNVQQLLRCAALLHPRHGGVALAFASGKALRVALPALVALAICGTALLAPVSPLFAALACCQAAAILLAACGAALGARAPRPLAVLHYAAAGTLASLMGLGRYLLDAPRGAAPGPWRVPAPQSPQLSLYTPRSVAAAKRGLDIAVALAGLAATLPLWPLIALAIRLESPGPVLARQLRVGRVLPDRTELFVMLKFRSERAEAPWHGHAGAARPERPATRVGAVLRATRLDELPQLLNVLRGEMAVIGPRPERPRTHARLAREIPFFAERTAGLRPGITGLAQLRQRDDAGIEGAHRKLAFDHAYAMGLTGLRAWLLADAAIMARTLAVLAGAGRPGRAEAP